MAFAIESWEQRSSAWALVLQLGYALLITALALCLHSMLKRQLLAWDREMRGALHAAASDTGKALSEEWEQARRRLADPADEAAGGEAAAPQDASPPSEVLPEGEGALNVAFFTEEARLQSVFLLQTGSIVLAAAWTTALSSVIHSALKGVAGDSLALQATVSGLVAAAVTAATVYLSQAWRVQSEHQRNHTASYASSSQSPQLQVAYRPVPNSQADSSLNI